ncbi:MAG: 50S ribosomal protein L35 [Patescibacteria group bacterium]
MSNKTYKALAKRVKVTKNGKILKRKAGQDHFNTRDTGKVTRNKRRDVTVVSFQKLVNENKT